MESYNDLLVILGAVVAIGIVLFLVGTLTNRKK
jgi:hypothetical protein